MKVFISFSSLDKKIAEKIYDRLKKKNIDCWICTKDIPPGADYQACIVDAINNAQVVVLVFSSQANSSSEIAKELSLASKKVLIPARIEDVVPQGSFQYQLSNRQFVDLFEDFDDKLEDLADRIKAVLESGVDNGVSTTSVKPRSKFRVNKLIKPAAIFAGVIGLAGFGWFFVTKQSVSLLPQQSVAIETPKVNSISSAETQVSQGIATSVELAPVTVSDKVNGLLSMVGNTTSYSRLDAIKAIKDQLPSNMNYLEASEFLKGTAEIRQDAISVIAKNLTPNLGGKVIAVILGDTSTYNRLDGIKSIVNAGKVKDGLQADEAKLMLEGAGQIRHDAISVIAKNLTPNLGGKEIAVILGDTSTYNRLDGIKSIANAGKIKSGLKPDEIDMILQNIESQRIDGLKVLTPYLAK